MWLYVNSFRLYLCVCVPIWSRLCQLGVFTSRHGGRFSSDVGNSIKRSDIRRRRAGSSYFRRGAGVGVASWHQETEKEKKIR